jgi:hypothetical protein
MVHQIKSFLREHHTLVLVLVAQAIAIVAYAVKLETRVTTMETRGAPHVAERLGKIDQRLTAIEGQTGEHEARINRMLNEVLKDRR